MTSLAVETVVAQLSRAGLNIFLAAEGGLAVAPRSLLTDDLRELIRSSKALLIDWVTSASDAASHAPGSSDNPLDWKALAAAYHAHHFNCPTCIAAGRGNQYGQRCAAGIALWSAYSERCAPASECPVNPLPSHHD